MNLAKLFEMQEKLDDHILDEHPELRGQNNLDWKILALLVELGECANEWRGFKKWSNDQLPRTESDEGHECPDCEGTGLETGNPDDGKCLNPRCCDGVIWNNPLLEEYVDCLHFILSIGLEMKISFDFSPISYKLSNTTEQFNSVFEDIGIFRKSIDEDWEIEDRFEAYESAFGGFVGLGKMLGFTQEQIEQAYFEKNAVNHQRQEDGY